MTRSNAQVLFAAMSILFASPAFAESASLPATARKIVVEKAGEGYRWQLVQAPLPTISAHQVLVRVHAVSLNRSEVSRLQSKSDDQVGRTPVSDAAGEIVAVGHDVKDLRKGARVTNTYFQNWTEGAYAEQHLKRVHGWTIDGVAAEYIALERTAVAPIPDGYSYEEAATLPTAGLTAWNAIAGRVDTRAGDIVVVQGTGGVATFALQFAVALGARVIVTSSSDEKLSHAKALGAHDGINYRQNPDWADRVLQITNGHGADLVVDVVGKSTLEQSVSSLADEGTLAIIGGITGYDGSIPAWGLLKKSATARGIFVGSRSDYLRMNAFMSKHKLRPLIDRVYPIEEYEQALRQMASGNFMGKIVLTFQHTAATAR